jgi:hypothetical protein
VNQSLRSGVTGLLKSLGLLGLCASAGAQGLAILPDESAAESLKCIAGNDAKGKAIAYPERELMMRTGGTVRVRLEFVSPASGPRVEVLSSPTTALAEEVRRYVEDYRLPCMKKEAPPVIAVQEFSFDPRDGQPVTWARPQASSALKQACEITGIEKTQNLQVPRKAVQEGYSGTVLALAQFDGPDIAPVVTILHKGGHRVLAEAVVNVMQQLRAVCAGPSNSWPIKASQVYRFNLEGEATVALKDVDLKTFVAAIERLGEHKVRFDLNSMGCPFAVELAIYQPYLRNRVGEVGKTDPNRQGFLDWLQSVSLRIPPQALDRLLGSTMRISVPCGLLDLTT